MGAAQYNGTPSPDLQARLNEALILYRDDLAPLVVVTGYKEKGDRFTEAQAGGMYLEHHDVPSSAIAEVGGMDSYENLADAAALLKDSNARLLDVREPWEFSTARIEGSVAMPMGDVAARAHQELDPEERLVVLCHHGMRSMNVTVWLRNQGFEQVQSLRGGIDAWSAEVDPNVPRY